MQTRKWRTIFNVTAINRFAGLKIGTNIQLWFNKKKDTDSAGIN